MGLSRQEVVAWWSSGRIWYFCCYDLGSIPDQGTEIPQVTKLKIKKDKRLYRLCGTMSEAPGSCWQDWRKRNFLGKVKGVRCCRLPQNICSQSKCSPYSGSDHFQSEYDNPVHFGYAFELPPEYWNLKGHSLLKLT